MIKIPISSAPPARASGGFIMRRGETGGFKLVGVVVLVGLVSVTRSRCIAANGEVWISDLTCCAPSEAISRDGKPGRWIAVDYEVDEGAGVMLYGTGALNPPPITLPLKSSGLHAIYLGIHYGSKNGFVADRRLQVKLTRDAAFSRMRKEHLPGFKEIGWNHISEAFWKVADLSGNDLVFARPSKGTAAEQEGNLAYVRLVPLDEAAVAEWKAEQPREDTKRLIGNYDGMNLAQWHVSTHEDFLAEFECMRDSDFDITLYGMAHGPITFYPSKVGELVPPGSHWSMGDAVADCIANGIDPLRQAISAAHDCGVKLFAQVRFLGPQLPTDHLRHEHGGRFMAEHPEWMATYPDGKPSRHLSFAFEGVRQFYVRLLREWVEDYKADGINAIFSRSYPFVYYEEPVCERFREKYGEDMRKVPQDDRRTWKVRASFLTQFLREIRAMLDEVGEAQRRHIAACYNVPHSNPHRGFPGARDPLDEPLHAALDVRAWIDEGLVDYLVLHLHGHLPETIQTYARLAKGTRTKIIADIYPRYQLPRQFRDVAMTYYNAGADALAFWDSYNRYHRSSEWAFIKRLGHREELAAWKGKGENYFRLVPLKSLDGFLLGKDRYFGWPTDG